jgi:hypothetical protein
VALVCVVEGSVYTSTARAADLQSRGRTRVGLERVGSQSVRGGQAHSTASLSNIQGNLQAVLSTEAQCGGVASGELLLDASCLTAAKCVWLVKVTSGGFMRGRAKSRQHCMVACGMAHTSLSTGTLERHSIAWHNGQPSHCMVACGMAHTSFSTGALGRHSVAWHNGQPSHALAQRCSAATGSQSQMNMRYTEPDMQLTVCGTKPGSKLRYARIPQVTH